MSRKRFEATPEQRAEVRSLAGYGTNQEAIARRIGISIPTLAKYFHQELQRGVEEANIQVAQSAFNQAVGRKWVRGPDGTEHLERCDPVPTMTIYWLKCRLGWREPPMVYEHIDSSLAHVPTEELERRLAELRGRRGAADWPPADPAVVH